MEEQTSELYERIKRHLIDANEELLGLHRIGPLTYEEYAQAANYIVDAQETLDRLLKGQKSEETETTQTIPIPLWLFRREDISPLAKWTYAHLLKLRREFVRPSRNALDININLVSRDIFKTYAWTEKHLLSALDELTKAEIITSRKMDYPQDTPEHYEIGFLKEDRV